MKSMILAGFLLGSLIGVQAQEPNQEATLSDVVKALERIEERIDLDVKRFNGDDDDRVDFGGAPIFPVRVLLGQANIQKYFDEGGSYQTSPSILYPFANGGGGTWRWTFEQKLSIGFNYYGYGFSSLGYLKHDTAAEGPNATVDENLDGYDDYYSYAGYGMSVWSFVVSYRIPIEGTPVAFFVGTQAGIGNENVGFSRSDRTKNILANAVGIQIGDLDWSRTNFATGGWAGVEFGGRRAKLAIEAGMDYYIPMGEWSPEAGMHRTDVKPPVDLNNMNVWFVIGPHFNY